jgi:hypothetical protein
VIKEYRADTGLEQHLARLGEYVSSMNNRGPDDRSQPASQEQRV